jgi:lysozyme
VIRLDDGTHHKEIGTDGINLIHQFEGLRLHAYRDAAGILTVGYGHKILPGESLTEISETQADSLLLHDVKLAQDAINKLVKHDLTQNEFDALACLVFNIGISAFKTSTMLRKLNRGDLPAASEEFARWNKTTINGALVPLPGLTARRFAEKQLFSKQRRSELDHD